MKDIINRLFAFILFLSLIPLLIIVSLCIVIFDKSLPIFIQNRVGLNRIEFKIYKFRSMKNQSPTVFGKIIRKTGIDELPQLLNIIKGNINFIGPRPLTQIDIKRLDWEGNYYDFRWRIKPGLTGLAQLSPICHKKMSLFLDKYYINNQSLFLNLKISFASIFILFLGKNRLKKIISK